MYLLYVKHEEENFRVKIESSTRKSIKWSKEILETNKNY